MKVVIDDKSGFCFGVVNAIKKAEKQLLDKEEIFCLGDIVHNGKELERLEKLGLRTIQHNDLHHIKNSTVLFRAHGEPPSTYNISKQQNITIVDATCPVVLALQKRIKNVYAKNKDNNSQIVIYGKKGHAEVNGLVGQTNNEAIVVESEDDISLINPDKKTFLFSQTTKSIDGFQKLIKVIKSTYPKLDIEPYDTICRQVSNRIPHLSEFAKKFDCIVFVSGKKSSNGKVLYEICLENNAHCFFVSSPDELDINKLQAFSSVGICGATSTPRWLMEKIADQILHKRDN